MQVTVGSLKEYLDSYDDEAVVKFAIETSNGTSRVLDYGFISVSTEEVYGKEIVVHPYFFEASVDEDPKEFERVRD